MPATGTREGQVVDVQPSRPKEPGPGDLEAISRFLTGILILGGDELLQRLRAIQQEVEADPNLLDQRALEDETTATLLRYLALGLVARGQRGITKGVRSGFLASLGATSWVFGKVDRLTDNRLMRPVRRPIESRLRDLGQATGIVIREGQIEDQKSKLVATEGLGEIIDDVLDFVGRNPEMQQAVRSLIAQQGVGFGRVVGDNARQLSVTGDNITEALVRRLLRRSPRSDLPPSLLEGKAQTMYAPETQEAWKRSHDE
jgi:hypothetical protein